MNRRTLLSAPVLLAVPLADLIQREVVVLKGIRFLGKYPKEVYYVPDDYKELDPKFFTQEAIDYRKNNPFTYLPEYVTKYTPAPLSVYANVIEQQKALGYKSWELIV